MGSLLIVTGPPGAGKSTIAAELVTTMSPSALVEGDRFFGFLATGAIPPWLPESHTQNDVVTRSAALATGQFARHFETVYDGVVGPWFLPTFATTTGLRELDYVIVLPTVEVCVQRVRDRVGHGFTDEAATRKMHAEFASADIEPRHVLIDSDTDPRSAVDATFAARQAGQLRYRVA